MPGPIKEIRLEGTLKGCKVCGACTSKDFAEVRCPALSCCSASLSSRGFTGVQNSAKMMKDMFLGAVGRLAWEFLA